MRYGTGSRTAVLALLGTIGIVGAGSAAIPGEPGAPLLLQQTDTVVAVPEGARLDLRNHAGSIVVETWERSAVRIRATYEEEREIGIRLDGSVLRVRGHPGGGHDWDEEIDFRLTVPRGMSVDVGGVETSIRLEGVGGEVVAQSVEGEIEVTGGAGRIELGSVDGDVVLRGADGSVRVENVDGDVRIDGSSGEIVATSVDGDVLLEGIESPAVNASTVDGEIVYRGTIRDDGAYRFATHDGNIWIAVPEGTNASVTVSSVDGELDASFPVTLEQQVGGGRYTYDFQLGNGSARLSLETFDGVVQLRRPGEAGPRR